MDKQTKRNLTARIEQAEALESKIKAIEEDIESIRTCSLLPMEPALNCCVRAQLHLCDESNEICTNHLDTVARGVILGLLEDRLIELREQYKEL